MRTVAEFDIRDGLNSRKIQICVGDLTEVPEGQETELLGISAFNGDYAETSTSVIGALGRVGLHVGAMKGNQPLSISGGNTWISQPLMIPRVPYKRVVCTETPPGKTPRHAVGYFLTGLAGFLMRNPELRKISVPILGAGDQRDNKEGAFKNLIKETAICLRGGLQLTLFRVVVLPSDEADVLRWLKEVSEENPHIGEAYNRAPTYGAFLSYSRMDGPVVARFYERLKNLGVEVFMDLSNLEPGDVWAEQLDVAIARSRVFVPFVSASFNASIYCKQETDHAERLHGSGAPSLFPICIEKVDPIPPLAKRHAVRMLDYPAKLFAQGHTVEALCDKVCQRIRG